LKGPAVQPLLLVTDSADLAEEIQRLVESLLGPIALEVLHEDGPLALARLQAQPHRLAFLPLRMRGMEAITLLRLLGPRDAGRVVVLAPDTLGGCRLAWECLDLGAADILPLRGASLRLKGPREHRVRQIAIHLAREGEPPLITMPDLQDTDRPWIAFPEPRHLMALTAWLRRQPRVFPFVVRVPEGPRLRRVVGEELIRVTQWPVRQVDNSDRLVAGQVHLFSDPDLFSLHGRDGRLETGLTPLSGPAGSWAARREQLEALAQATARFGLLLPEPLEPVEESILAAARPVLLRWTEHDAVVRSDRADGAPAARRRAA
jgi:CheY-like chemotaxis protein